MSEWWEYDQLQSRNPTDWAPATKGNRFFDQLDFHLDLGCGTVPKARLGIDRFYAPGVDLLIDLDKLQPALLGPDECSAETIVAQRATASLFKLHANGYRRTPEARLPFPDNSIESIITHHFFEHLRDGFIPLMDECYRVLKPGGVLRIIVPLFPSNAAVADPDHKRYFMEGSWEMFCGTSDGKHWAESFSVPYTKCRFQLVDEDVSPPTDPALQWTRQDAREMRVALRKWS